MFKLLSLPRKKVLSYRRKDKPGPEIIKKFMLNAAEHEFSNAYKYENIKIYSIFHALTSLEYYFSC